MFSQGKCQQQQPQPQGLTEWEELTEEQRQQQLQELTGGVNDQKSWQERQQRLQELTGGVNYHQSWLKLSTTTKVDRSVNDQNI